MTEFIALFGTSQINFIVTLIAVDVILGIIASFMKKDFRMGKLAKFMLKPVVGYVFGFAVLEMVAQVLPSLAMMVSGAYILIVLALVSSVLSNLVKMGLPVPAFLQRE